MACFLLKVLDEADDVWEPRPNPKGRPEPMAWLVKVALVQGGRVGSLPTTGRVSQSELWVSANARVKRGVVMVQHRGKRLPPGWYEVTEDGRVAVKKRPPKLRKG